MSETNVRRQRPAPGLLKIESRVVMVNDTAVVSKSIQQIAAINLPRTQEQNPAMVAATNMNRNINPAGLSLKNSMERIKHLKKIEWLFRKSNGAVSQPDPPEGSTEKNASAIMSFIFGLLSMFILALALLVLPGNVALIPIAILGVLAMIFGGIGIGKSAKQGRKKLGFAIAGLVMGIFGAIIGIGGLIVSVFIL